LEFNRIQKIFEWRTFRSWSLSSLRKMPFALKCVLIAMALVSALGMTGLQAQELNNATPGDLDGEDKNAAALFRTDVLPRIDLLPTITHAEKERLHDLLMRSMNLSRLFTIHFETSNTRLVASEVDAIKQRLHTQQVQTCLSDQNVVILVLGFGDRPIPKSRDVDVAELRAQSITNFLREQCRVRQPIYSLSMREEASGEQEHATRRRVAEVWAVRP
jgi:hypothetical protein